MTVNDASLGESGSKLSKVAATSLLMGVTRASSEAYSPSLPSERSPKDIRFPVMQKAPPILQNENGGALSHLEFGKALQTC